MGSADVFLDNITRLADKHNLKNYKQIAKYLNVSLSTYKQWASKNRFPTLKKLDQIANHLGINTYCLIKKDSCLDNICVNNNDSRLILVNNLKTFFDEKNRVTWEEKAGLFFGLISVEMLKSYFRSDNYRVPTLYRLDEMASTLGKAAFLLIKESGLK